MDLYDLVKPTGIAAFVLFVLALLNGIPRLRLLRYHAVTGYACCLLVLAHSAAALWCHAMDPVGILASAGMVLTTLSGYLRWRLSLHVILSFVTLAFAVLHIILVW
jgi:hypothetical protein